MFDWNDVRFFLALQRNGKLLGAARQMGTTHATVARHIAALEKVLGQPLFVQQADGYSLTAAGRQLLPLAESLENTASQMLDSGSKGHAEVSGVVRLGAPEGLGALFLARHMPALMARYPELEIDLVAVPRFVSITSREVDIAIALERPQANMVVTRKLTDYCLGLYATQAYLAAHPPIREREDLNGHAILAYVDDLLFTRELMYHHGLCRHPSMPLRSTSVVAQREAALADGGIAVLPYYTTYDDPRLTQILPELRIIRSYWISARSNIRRTLRYRVVWDYVVELCQNMQWLLLQEEQNRSIETA
ncbi:LysR family transcriptional regulator [Chromobacterium violaceum]|uniref:D-malate degradation protein R n=1 Tax=Chromobacterium violaceum TaxID=536 RepID=A0A381ESE1_CHRVL|nr:LysR family transcriptional regulator [Chromobacterium violaceum]KJH67322.1 LysR family transcriptional regulator [Chromobacterium violaceum]MBP4046831.1 LysR family transcriptional regulator [Chromobacterium violaceum]MBP4050646.1 LysR family transcriptional regulator [Chromobacterium violaceum]MBX9267767.1 LysR family transcriptional regulator [Chromobacterium violaceum]MCD0493762.1 LysR family transcriptional regulator [Chromobacterium violaceum]